MITHKHHFSRLLSWIKEHRALSLIVLGVILITIASVAAFYILSKPDQPKQPLSSPTPVVKKEEPKPKYYVPLTGLEVTDQSTTTKPVTGIMIENSPDARPQSGLKQAEVVYEAIAEGGITRFLALYQQNKPQLIGPVRSVRMYYVDWLKPYDASVAHVGGSAAALKEVRNGSYRDLDQFFNSASYWRATDRYAPHNVYTSFDKLDALNAAKGFASSSPKVFARKDSGAAETPQATSISVTMSGPLYNSSYTYDKTTNLYTRYQAGAIHKDREDGPITPRVVIVIKATMQNVMEDGWREQYQTTGSGNAVIFQDGTTQEVTWHKADASSQYSFTGADGKDVALARGQTWISVVPEGEGGVSWQ